MDAEHLTAALLGLVTTIVTAAIGGITILWRKASPWAEKVVQSHLNAIDKLTESAEQTANTQARIADAQKAIQDATNSYHEQHSREHREIINLLALSHAKNGNH